MSCPGVLTKPANEVQFFLQACYADRLSSPAQCCAMQAQAALLSHRNITSFAHIGRHTDWSGVPVGLKNTLLRATQAVPRARGLEDPVVIIDCDPGIDDTLAVMWAMAAELNIAGFTIVHGNNDNVYLLARNMTKLLCIMGWDRLHPHVKVHKGLDRPAPPISRLFAHEGTRFHGMNGFGGQEEGTLSISGADISGTDATATALISAQNAVDFMVQTVAKAPAGTAVICALGPLTNVGEAIRKGGLPFLQKRPRIVIMGGAFGGLGSVKEGVQGNATPVAEANIFNNPEAAQVVFESGLEVEVFPLDVTHQVHITEEWQNSLRMQLGDTGAFLDGMLTFYRQAYLGLQRTSVPMHDALPVAWLAGDRGLFVAQTRQHVRVVAKEMSMQELQAENDKPYPDRLFGESGRTIVEDGSVGSVTIVTGVVPGATKVLCQRFLDLMRQALQKAGRLPPLAGGGPSGQASSAAKNKPSKASK